RLRCFRYPWLEAADGIVGEIADGASCEPGEFVVWFRAKGFDQLLQGDERIVVAGGTSGHITFHLEFTLPKRDVAGRIGANERIAGDASTAFDRLEDKSRLTCAV